MVLDVSWAGLLPVAGLGFGLAAATQLPHLGTLHFLDAGL
jgi:hypothetical protein